MPRATRICVCSPVCNPCNVCKSREYNREKQQERRADPTKRKAELEKKRAVRAANVERAREIDRAWYAQNVEARRIVKRAYDRKRPEMVQLRRHLTREWIAKEPEKSLTSFRRTRGIKNPEICSALVALQNAQCAICKTEISFRSHADHDKHTGLMRGMLCSRCNHAIGLLLHDPARADAAAAYLREPPATKLT